jgi:SagB-type dehydrogenase family enzyme
VTRELRGRRRQWGDRYRRSPALVIYSRSTGPVAFDCRSGSHSHLTNDLLHFISALSDWHTVAQLRASRPALGSPRNVRTLLDALVKRGLLERQFATSDDWLWQSWSPHAAFFHFGTRNPTYPATHREYELELQDKARQDPPPPPTKSVDGSRIVLPTADVRGSLEETLRARRTWRQFAAGQIGLEQIGSLLQLTFGVQQRQHVKGQGEMVRKTSPSGGARHSIEAYLVALNVKRLRAGAYHYDASTHELVDVERSIDVDAIAYALANQPWFTRAGALVVMSAMFERAMWRYPFNRAYRSILTEAGHLGQTFCLVATALGLAPFCTMAFRDREIEGLIGVDGVNESAMYVVGVGTRPRGRVTNPGKIGR